MRWQSPLLLFLRSALWTVLFPGMVAGYIPWRFFDIAGDLRNVGVIDIMGIVVSACGAAILLQSIVEFARRGRGTLSPLDPARELVVTGLYRWVRNPMYVGVMLVLLGELMIAPSLALAVYAASFFIAVNTFTRHFEEPYLQRTFGSSYDVYRHNVRRWIPRLTAWGERP
jgi:protein-S-isoprenylcysteine O-methyltransferase Ste14